MDYVYILREALIWIITIFWLYQILVSVCSLVKLKDKPLKVNKNHRFMAIIPAHNEEAVVGNLIESLKNQEYDKNLYDIYVIADNCTDRTARIAREAGAIVYERYDETKKTKGYALDWFLQQKIKEDVKKEENGIEISTDVIAVIAGVAVSEVQGVASMSGGFAGGITEVLSGKKNMAKGIKVDKTENTAKIDVNIIVEYGSRIPDVAFEIQNRVKKSVESMTGFKVEEVNVHVQGVDTNISKSENTDNQKETNENEGEK